MLCFLPQDSKSFASFISHSQLPSAVRVRLPPSVSPAVMDEAYRQTTAPLAVTPNPDGWTHTHTPGYAGSEITSPDNLVSNFTRPIDSETVRKYQEMGGIIESLTLDKRTSGNRTVSSNLNDYLCVTYEFV